jgi:hypothetical protein
VDGDKDENGNRQDQDNRDADEDDRNLVGFFSESGGLEFRGLFAFLKFVELDATALDAAGLAAHLRFFLSCRSRSAFRGCGRSACAIFALEPEFDLAEF